LLCFTALKKKFSRLNDIISQGKVELGNARDGHWELEGNIVGTHWEPGKNEKKSFFSPPPPPLNQHLKRKKQGTLSACLGFPIGCMKFVFPKEFVTILGLG
jgi:hypothetical protein